MNKINCKTKKKQQLKMRQLNILSSILLSIIIFLSIPQISSGNKPSKTKYIVVDQFGYRPEASKIAVIRNPQTGFDADESFTPGSSYAVINVEDSSQVLTGTPVAWNNGSTDSSSGDKAWWFDFSELKDEGTYFILDVDSNLCSYNFEIKQDVYQEVMIQAMRTFFYQRSGYEKQPPFACEEWTDEASHLQDKHARDFLDKNNPATERDVSGGWYDAGDYNKYTSWTANYIVGFMKAFLENPGVWGDDYNIPESGNGVPDILDEAKWGLEHLLRMQISDGSLLSIVGAAHASPPSAATGPSYYGRPNTSGTLNAAAAFAIASKVYRSAGMKTFADSLKASAVRAWNWADENPNVIFRNNEGNTQGLGAGQQETDDYGRLTAKLEAASFLYEITGEAKYKTFFESNYSQIHLMQWTYAYPFETTNQETLLYYTTLNGVSSSVKSAIINKYQNAMNGSENFPAFTNGKDPFLAHIKDYTWGSNSVKAGKGLMFTDFVDYDINSSKNGQALEAAENYIHYIHGVNPLNMVYLSNMYNFGAENCVNEFYHSWFTDGSTKWDRVGESTYGPAPGFLTGGPNPSYDWDGCCPNGCGSSSNNAKCYGESISPPKNQPNQKSYKDFNTSWPLNSWSVTENSCGYQISYIRLLAKFLPAKYDCAGTFSGSATYDACGVCSGGATGLTPENNPENCLTTSSEKTELKEPQVYPNPASTWLHINYHSENYNVQILNTSGQIVISENAHSNKQLNIQHLPSGQYIVVITDEEDTWKSQLVKL
jgi:hypothetical protein